MTDTLFAPAPTSNAASADPQPSKLSAADRKLFRGTAAEVHPWMSTADILSAIGCNFRVTRHAAQCGERRYGDCQLWLRDDTQDLLGFFGNRRQVIQPQVFIDYFRAFADASDKAISLDVVGALDGGRTLYMAAKLHGNNVRLLDSSLGGGYGAGGGLGISRPGTSAYLPSEDRTDHWLILTESFGESLRPRVMTIANELVCSNGLASKLTDCEVRLSHHGSLAYEHVAAVLEHALRNSRAYARIKDRLAATPISLDTARAALRTYFADPDGKGRMVQRLEAIYQRDLIGGELDSRAGTAWGLASAVTQYTSHESIRDEAKAFKSQLDGGRARTASGFLSFLEGQFSGEHASSLIAT
jgi:hypothetical protein